MKRLFLLLVLSLSFFHLALGQSIAELEARFRKAASKSDKLNLAYQLAERMLASNAAKAGDYANQASQLAVELGEKRKETDANLLSAEAAYKTRNNKEAAQRFTKAWNTARTYGHRDATLAASEKLQEIALKQNDYKEALKWSRETLAYLKDSGGSSRGGGDAQRKMENQLAQVMAENRALKDQLAQLAGQRQNITTTYEEQLRQVQEKTQAELIEKEAAITEVTIKNQQIDSINRYTTRKLATLTKEQMMDSIVRSNLRRDIEAQKLKTAEAELERSRSHAQRNLLGSGLLFVLVLALLFFLRFQSKQRYANQLNYKNAQLDAEQKRANTLLLNILPEAIAQELKAHNKVKAKKHEQATVMFVDFKGFTSLAETMPPEQLVEELNHYFSKFDEITSKHGIEKIKTIGDAYLCAVGLSGKQNNPSVVVHAALEIQSFMQTYRATCMMRNQPFFDARIGIHSGPVVAGVVGTKKFAYDIWGDTVNVAARMEEACEKGMINVSEAAYWLTKYDFEWMERGRIPAKNKGNMEMFYAVGVKS
jgi:class 3 adenylate cyclase